jgi:oxygen-dependent protoporphyrinogen oxidase
VRHSLLGTGFVVPRVERQLTIMAASWVSSKWPNRAPRGQVVLRAFVGGARDPRALDREDDELVRQSERDLGAILGIDGRQSWARVYRWERANAQHEVGHLDRLRAIDERLARWPGLFVTGSAFRGVGIPDCVADGRATAAAAAVRAPLATF